jgi:hypothetical protein
VIIGLFTTRELFYFRITYVKKGTTVASTETMRISTEYMRDNAIETSRVAVNDAKMLEEATHISHGISDSKSS